MRHEHQNARSTRHASRRSPRHDEVLSAFCRRVNLHPEQLRAAFPNVVLLLHTLTARRGGTAGSTSASARCVLNLHGARRSGPEVSTREAALP